ncbi:hypothetical protein Clacol_007192 [Clathrus columnatus]|uniref:Methyltransferase domain-containing protein n=1 Tax=Clathrus columnatus TaxID=1419009 RepID=A0AAV5AFA8_9AGAM|nr:hypothetical protein Clacol_007192 [Clathrus columnatus]
MSTPSSTYLHGHHQSVLRSHSWRTANMYILDIGCGPGTITVDFAVLVPDGKVLGVEYSPDVLEQARTYASGRGVKNIEFTTGDIHSLDYPDNTFDIVHAHQVLQHLRDPLKAFSEMRRVTKPGGYVAIREGEVSTFTWYPENKDLDEWLDVYLRSAQSINSSPAAGRQLIALARKAGFERKDIIATASSWCFNIPEDRSWWGKMWADRTLTSSFAKSVIDAKEATREDLERYAQAWKIWEEDEDGWFAMIHSEVVCKVEVE